jgi:hypothetical protein
MTSERIKNIDCHDIKSWHNKIFLTFDLDWVSDDVLNYTLDVIEKQNVAATWFITHHTPLLERIGANPNFEMGIHPNFNFLLKGDISNGKGSDEILDKILEIVPDSKSVRSHSLVQSTILQKCFADKNQTHDCNHFIPYQSEIEIKPWKLWNGLIKCPHFWEDDLMCAYGAIEQKLSLKTTMLQIFAFHPIHVFLNTENLNRYETARPYFNKYKKLKQYENRQKFGTRNFLLNLLQQLDK